VAKTKEQEPGSTSSKKASGPFRQGNYEELVGGGNQRGARQRWSTRKKIPKIVDSLNKKTEQVITPGGTLLREDEKKFNGSQSKMTLNTRPKRPGSK